MVVLPTESPSTSPLVTGATAGAEELHEAESVRSCLLLSLKVPVAVSCSVTPKGIVELAGVTAIETRAAAVTVRVAAPETVGENTAPILDVPTVRPWAMPSWPATLLTVATVGAEDVQ